MVSVLLIWIYMFITMMLSGAVMLQLSERLIGYRSDSVRVYILAGLAAATVYSQIFSLFGGVSLLANIIYVCLSLVGVFFMRRSAVPAIRQALVKFTESRVYVCVAAALILLMAIGTSHGYIHYDTGLYHAQAIRWIEEYGVVKGLGNLHCRLGYNSAAFPLTALYSFAFVSGRSYHVVSGFCALLLAFECLGLGRNIRERKLDTAAFARLMGLYYLFMIYDEMISPASDYYMVTLAFILVIRLLDVFEKDEPDEKAAAMLAFLACLILTIKLSGAFLILCAIYPGVIFVKKKQYVKLIASLATGVVIIVPYLIRNVLISGWLLYPSTAIDIFNVDWKVPKEMAAYDFKEIQVYGRGYTDVSKYETPITEWFGNWFNSQSLLDRLFIAAAIGAVLYFVVKCIYYGFSLCRGKKVHGTGRVMYTEALLVICFSYWLCTSPLMRYGCLFVYLTAAVIWGRVLLSLLKNRYALSALYVCLGLVMIYKIVMFGREFAASADSISWVTQQDYDNFETKAYTIGGLTFYAPVEGDRTGYADFPSTPWEMDIELRGDDYGDGFRAK